MVDISEGSMKLMVYISNSNNTTFKLSNKVLGVCLDHCAKCTLVTQDVLANVEIVNSQRITVQITGAVNSVQVI